MEVYKYGNDQASIVLIQMVGEHDLSIIKQEIVEIQKLTEMKFQFIAIKVNSWNHDLSPWNASAVFGSEGFGDGAEHTLKEVLQLCTDSNKPSIWFPGFLNYMKQQKMQSDCIYLSLGNKEEKTRNPMMKQVGDCIREAYAWFNEEGIQCTLEWNQGGHFKEPHVRTAKAFAWIMKNI